MAYADPNTDRREANRILYKQALDRLRASDASLAEKVSARATVVCAMKIERKLGMGLRKKALRLRKKKCLSRVWQPKIYQSQSEENLYHYY